MFSWVSPVSQFPAGARALFVMALAAHWLCVYGDDANDATQVQQAARTAIYYDPARSGEGLFVESLGGDRALVYFLSYRAKLYWDYGWWGWYEQNPNPAWMIGLGVYEGNRLLADLVIPVNGQFGDDFDAEAIDYIEFGSLVLQFPTCGSSESQGSLEIQPISDLGYMGDQKFEELEQQGRYVQLSQVIDCETGIEKASPQFNNTGSWYDPSRPGEGLVVEVLENDRAVVVWMTYDHDGNQMWLQGIGDIEEVARYNGLLTIDDMRIYSGSYWGSDFDASDVTSTHFGSVTLGFWLCNHADMTYDSPEFGSGSLSLARLTSPMNVNPAGIGCWDY